MKIKRSTELAELMRIARTFRIGPTERGAWLSLFEQRRKASNSNECASEAGPQIVGLLVGAGADGGGKTGYIGIARALLDCRAATEAKNSKGDPASAKPARLDR